MDNFIIMEEIWKEIEDFDGVYFVSNYGRVKSIDRLIIRSDGVHIQTKGRVLIPRPATNGYMFVNLSKNGKSKNYSIHRLVATYFLNKIINKNEVNHIDGNKENNYVYNLEWCTRKENSAHASRNNLYNPHCKGKFGGLNPNSTKVIKFDKMGNVLKIYDSVTEAAEDVKCWRQEIGKCCLGKRKSAGGYKWKYYKEYLAETKYRDGSLIPEVTDNTAWAALTTGALCAYDNDWNNV